jgi:hypothetical protein
LVFVVFSHLAQWDLKRSHEMGAGASSSTPGEWDKLRKLKGKPMSADLRKGAGSDASDITSLAQAQVEVRQVMWAAGLSSLSATNRHALLAFV